MTLLLIVAAWLISVSLVAGLCMAARTGDRESLSFSPSLADAGEQSVSALVWEQADGVEISARGNVGRTRTGETGVAVLHGDGIAA